MAASLTPESSHMSSDITECSKCHQLLKNPKSLPCLHSYCAACLEDELEKEPKKTRFSCLVCGEEFDIPAGGVQEWRPLSIVHKLTEQKALQEKLMKKDLLRCTACVQADDKTDGKCVPPIAIARCTECDDYLCQRCVAIHKSLRILTNHPVFTLDELRAGKVAEIAKYEQRSCLKHKGEIMLFYCETCDTPICRQCVVIAHRHPEHKQCELDQAAAGKSETLRELQEACKNKKDILDKEIVDIRASKRELNDAISEAKSRIKDTVEKFKASYLSRLAKAEKKAEDEVNDVYNKASENIESTEKELISAISRISTAMVLNKQLLDKGTDYEIASDFASLKGVMQKLNDNDYSSSRHVNKCFGEIQFNENRQSEDEILLGHMASVREHGEIRATKVTTLKYEFGHNGQEPLQCALDIAMMPSGNYAVTDHSSAAKVKLYNPAGGFKSSFNVNVGVDAGTTTYPWCIKIGPDNLFNVTDYYSPFVKIFDLEGSYKRHFWTVSPDNVPYSSHGSSKVYGLAFDSKQQVLAGNITHNFISRHTIDGTHVSSIKVQISPWFLAVTSKDHVVVSSYSSSGEVHIIDETGQLLATFDMPTGLNSLHPSGVVTSTRYKISNDEDEIFVADRDNGHCVHRYSGTGKFINTVTKDVSNVYGIALSADEQQLIVADNNRVKCFDI